MRLAKFRRWVCLNHCGRQTTAEAGPDVETEPPKLTQLSCTARQQRTDDSHSSLSGYHRIPFGAGGLDPVSPCSDRDYPV